MQFRNNVIVYALVIISVLFSPASLFAAQDGGYAVITDIWLKAILQVPDSPVTLVWKEVGTDTTPSGDKVVSGYFYADPDDFAYGSQYNPEIFVKVYIASNGWANIAFNHVTVDDVSVYSALNYGGTADKTGTVALNSRLAEHQYDGVAPQALVAQPLKEPFIGLHWRGLAQYSYKPRNNTIEEYVEYNTLRHKENGPIDAVVLVVSWSDLQPFENTDEFGELYQAIYTLKKHGFQVVLYIWANAAENWQAWPDWVKADNEQDLYRSKDGAENWFPWSDKYQKKYRVFLRLLKDYLLEKNEAFPDAFVINAGGEFGEQVLDTYEKKSTIDLDNLFSAEKVFVDMHVEELEELGCELILAVNSLDEHNIEHGAEVAIYAKERGVDWFQSNAGICRLTNENYGPHNIELLNSINGKLILEDEYSGGDHGEDSCSPDSNELNARVGLMDDWWIEDGLRFNGVTLHLKDYERPDKDGFEALQDYLTD